MNEPGEPAETQENLERQSARELLCAAAAGESVSPMLTELKPSLEIVIRGVFKSWKTSLHGMQDDDIIQDVFLRLLEKPPTKTSEAERGDGRRALVRVRAWVKTVTQNFLRDIYRRAPQLPTEDQTLTNLTERTAATFHGRSGTAAQAEAAVKLRWLSRILSAEYPSGARWIEAMRDHPDATTAELAVVLDTTSANVYQISSRTRKVLSEIEDRARQKDQERRAIQ